jgi:hypothetical protein
MKIQKKSSQSSLAEANSVRGFSGDMLAYLLADLLQVTRDNAARASNEQLTPEFRTQLPPFFQHTILDMVPHGLVGYQVIVTPDGAPILVPNEFALVWYLSQIAYQSAQGTASRFAYGPLHWLLFNKKTSWSAYPELFIKQMEARKPVHLFANPVNPQNCNTRILLSMTDSKLTQDQARKQLALCLAEIQRVQLPGLESLICWTDRNYVVVWENWTKGSKIDTQNLDFIAGYSGEVIMRTEAKNFQISAKAKGAEPKELVVGSEGACFNFIFSR